MYLGAPAENTENWFPENLSLRPALAIGDADEYEL